jgi:glycosyltransferase involved in cell wall biosynthesis
MNSLLQIDNITIILGAIILLIALIAPMMSPFLRVRLKKKEVDDATDESKLPPISVIITVHNEGECLEKNLPLFLNQDYPADFQIIVVHENGDSLTDDIVKRHVNEKHFYSTFIPDSSRYMSKKKLAITIGVKAAKHEWIVLTDATCHPMSDKWLRKIGEACNNNINMVIGLAKYTDEAKRYYQYERTRTACYLLHEEIHGHAFRTTSQNLAFRKSVFIKEEGFRGNLQYLREEYGFLVNKYAEGTNIATVTDPESWMIDEAPSHKTWINDHLFYINAKKSLKHSWRFNFLHRIDTIILHLKFIAILGTIAFAAITNRWILLAAAILALLIDVTISILITRKTFKFLEIKMPSLAALTYEKCEFWHNINNKIRYIATNKNEFTSHKL